MGRLPKYTIVSVLVLGLAGLVTAQEKMTFKVEDPVGRNTVTFRSNAPLEDIIGTSNQLSGMLHFDPMHPENGGSGEISVPVASLNTSIPLRDEHLRGEAWLNAEKHPDITFSITEVKDFNTVKSGSEASTWNAVAVGTISLNGQSKEMSVPVRLTYLKETEMTKARMAGNLLAARAEFELTLADFGVTGPPGMDIIGSKVGETVEIDLTLVAASPTEAIAGN